jgi:hypothetical protein
VPTGDGLDNARRETRVVKVVLVLADNPEAEFGSASLSELPSVGHEVAFSGILYTITNIRWNINRDIADTVALLLKHAA